MIISDCFNETVHAFMSARYHTLLAVYGERGIALFIHAVESYVGQRGRRMARRALRDGEKLTHETFLRYGELYDTPVYGYTARERLSISPDFVTRITDCPWHRQFLAMGCEEAGRAYCARIDEALCRGFSPEIRFSAESDLNMSDCCLQRVSDVNYPREPVGRIMTEYKKDYDYHCAHLFRVFRDVCAAVLGAEGETITETVVNDFKNAYGQTMTDTLLALSESDFDSID